MTRHNNSFNSDHNNSYNLNVIVRTSITSTAIVIVKTNKIPLRVTDWHVRMLLNKNQIMKASLYN